MTTPDIAKLAECSPTAQALAEPDTPPVRFLDKLEQQGMLRDAISFVVHMLSPREAIQWACATVRALQPADKAINGQESLTAAETWLSAPSDAGRWAACEAAERSWLSHPTDCIAMAVFMSGGSITPPSQPEPVPATSGSTTRAKGQPQAPIGDTSDAPVTHPPPYASQRFCRGAVMLATVAYEPEKAADRQRIALALGRKQAGFPPVDQNRSG